MRRSFRIVAAAAGLLAVGYVALARDVFAKLVHISGYQVLVTRLYHLPDGQPLYEGHGLDDGGRLLRRNCRVLVGITSIHNIAPIVGQQSCRGLRLRRSAAVLTVAERHSRLLSARKRPFRPQAVVMTMVTDGR